MIGRASSIARLNDTMDKQKKKKNDQKKSHRWMYVLSAIAIVIVAIGILASIFLVGFISTTDILEDTTLSEQGESAQSQIESVLKTTLLDSVTNAYFYYTAWMDYFIYIRFDLPATDVPEFLDRLDHMCFEMPLQEGERVTGIIEIDQQWWQPEQAIKFVGSPQCGENPVWKLMIDQTDEDIWIVYITGFSL